MAQLARRHDGRTITRLEELAQREAVSANFLVQILNDLRRGQLIESRRGKGGGYLLGRQPDAISLLDIVEAVEPSLLATSTQPEGDCGAAVKRAWESVTTATREQLAAIPLKQLAERGGEPMYYI
ncbi:HTH-type transcriptional regulator CymR [Haloferula helveola]